MMPRNSAMFVIYPAEDWPIVDGHDSPEVRAQAAGVLRGLVVAPPLKDQPSRSAAVAARALHVMGERP